MRISCFFAISIIIRFKSSIPKRGLVLVFAASIATTSLTAFFISLLALTLRIGWLHIAYIFSTNAVNALLFTNTFAFIGFFKYIKSISLSRLANCPYPRACLILLAKKSCFSAMHCLALIYLITSRKYDISLLEFDDCDDCDACNACNVLVSIYSCALVIYSNSDVELYVLLELLEFDLLFISIKINSSGKFSLLFAVFLLLLYKISYSFFSTILTFFIHDTIS